MKEQVVEMCEQSIPMDTGHCFKLYPRGHSEEPDIRIPNMKETRKVSGNLQCKELEALRQRLEQETGSYAEKCEQELRKEKRFKK